VRIRSVLLALVTAAASAPAAPAPTGGTAAAKSANVRGMRLMTAKKYKDAMAEFGKAIAADRDYVLAHYNLACAAAHANDKTVADHEVEWVLSAAAWDATAAKAARKAPNDPDLKGLFGGPQDGGIDPDPGTAVHDLLDIKVDRDDAVPPAVAKLLATAPGKHDDQCDTSGEQARVRGIHDGSRWIVASLRDGVALVDGTKLLSKMDPLGCTMPGASQDQLAPIDKSSVSDFGPKELAGKDLIVVPYGNGGRRDYTSSVAVFAIKNGTQLEDVFDATLESSDDDGGAGTLQLTDVGDLVLGDQGAKQKRVFHWDPATFRYVEAKR
jgi:hypothetical protein